MRIVKNSWYSITPTVCKPARAKIAGPNRNKMQHKTDFVSRNIKDAQSAQDIFQKQFLMRQICREVLGK